MDSNSSSDDENIITYQDFKLLAQRKRRLDASSMADSVHFLSKKNKYYSGSKKLDEPVSIPNSSLRSLCSSQSIGHSTVFLDNQFQKQRDRDQNEIIDLCEEPSPVKYSRWNNSRARRNFTVPHDYRSPKQEKVAVRDLYDDLSPITENTLTETALRANKITAVGHLPFYKHETLHNVTTKDAELGKTFRRDESLRENVEHYQNVNDGKRSIRQMHCLNCCCAGKERNLFFDPINRNNQHPFLMNSDSSNNQKFGSDSHFTSSFLTSANHCNSRYQLSSERMELPVKLEQMEVIDLCSENMEEQSIEPESVRPSSKLKNVTKSFELFVKSILFEAKCAPMTKNVNIEDKSSLEKALTNIPAGTTFPRDSCGMQLAGIEKPLKSLEAKTTERVAPLKFLKGIDFCNDSDDEPLLVAVEREAVKPNLKLENVSKSFEFFVESAIASEDDSVASKNVILENTYSFEEITNCVPICTLSSTGFEREIPDEQLGEVETYQNTQFLPSQQSAHSVLRNEEDRNCTDEYTKNHLNIKKEAAITEQQPIFASSRLTQEVGTQTVLEVGTQTDDFDYTTDKRNSLPTTMPEQNVSAASSPIICSLPKIEDLVSTQLFTEEIFVAAHKNSNLVTINELELYEISVEEATDNDSQLDGELDLALEQDGPITENLRESLDEKPIERSQIMQKRTGRNKRIEVPLENILLNEEGQISIQEVGTVGWLQFALAIHKSFRDGRVGIVSNKRKYVCCKFLEDTETKAKRRNNTTKVFRKKKKRPSSRSRKNTTPCTTLFNVSDNGAADDDDDIVDRSKCKGSSALKNAMNKITKDKSLQSNKTIEYNSVSKPEIKRRIEDIFKQLFAAFEANMLPAFTVRIRSLDNCVMEAGRLQIVPFRDALLRNILYNRPSIKFVVMVHILGRIYNLLNNDLRITKRELYYQIRHLTNGGQFVLNNWIEEVTCLLDAAQFELNITARNGLVYGDLKLVFSSKETLNCNLNGTSIPCNVNEIVEIHTDAAFILIVEKESIFKQLIEEDLASKLEMPFILLTGKGFPDLNTQFFLKKLWELLSVPVFIVVDPDPHGIQIMFTYRFGSVANCHLSHHLAVPGVRWLGIFPSEILKYKLASTPLQKREKELTARLIRLPCVQDHPQIINELQTMLSKNRKASIESLVKDGTFLSECYLPGQFSTQNYL